MNLIVIYEKDHEDNEKSVIGVADSVKSVEKIIEEHYRGLHLKVISWTYNIPIFVYSKVVEIKWRKSKPSMITLTLEWFRLNES